MARGYEIEDKDAVMVNIRNEGLPHRYTKDEFCSKFFGWHSVTSKDTEKAFELLFRQGMDRKVKSRQIFELVKMDTTSFRSYLIKYFVQGDRIAIYESIRDLKEYMIKQRDVSTCLDTREIGAVTVLKGVAESMHQDFTDVGRVVRTKKGVVDTKREKVNLKKEEVIQGELMSRGLEKMDSDMAFTLEQIETAAGFLDNTLKLKGD